MVDVMPLHHLTRPTSAAPITLDLTDLPAVSKPPAATTPPPLALAEPPRYPRRKRVLDASVAGAALLLLMPVLLVLALLCRVWHGPGVIFRQRRIGLGGQEFTILKFRSVPACDETESATRWSVRDDARITKWGRFLRRTSLDELPQLWNVVRGDMSLVGPRPERPFFVAQFAQEHPQYPLRHRMPGGLTGLAQVSGLRGDTSISERARLDNQYIDNWSLRKDVAIIARTPVALLRGGE